MKGEREEVVEAQMKNGGVTLHKPEVSRAERLIGNVARDLLRGSRCSVASVHRMIDQAAPQNRRVEHGECNLAPLRWRSSAAPWPRGSPRGPARYTGEGCLRREERQLKGERASKEYERKQDCLQCDASRNREKLRDVAREGDGDKASEAFACVTVAVRPAAEEPLPDVYTATGAA
eukprot:4756267-Pleurochrysis_carterae.AAC.2